MAGVFAAPRGAMGFTPSNEPIDSFAMKTATACGSVLRPGTGFDGRYDVLHAAAEIFNEFGFAATSIDAVADRLGATKGRIYHYYRSKADLFFDVQIAAMRLIAEQVRPLAQEKIPAPRRLLAMAFRHARVLLHDMTMQKVAVQGLERHLLGAAAARHTSVLHSIIAMRDDYEAMFASVILEGGKTGDFLPMPRSLSTKAFFGALNWSTIWYQPESTQSVEAIDALSWDLARSAVRSLLSERGARQLYDQLTGRRPVDKFVVVDLLG